MGSLVTQAWGRIMPDNNLLKACTLWYNISMGMGAETPRVIIPNPIRCYMCHLRHAA